MLCLRLLLAVIFNKQRLDAIGLRDNVHTLAASLLGNGFSQSRSSCFNRARCRNSCCDDFDVLLCKRFPDATPILDSWKALAC